MSVAVTANAAQDSGQASLRAPRLLSDLQPQDIADQPYAHFTRSNVVPSEVYAALEAEFPKLEMILNGRDAGSNQAVRMTIKQVLNDRRKCFSTPLTSMTSGALLALGSPCR